MTSGQTSDALSNVAAEDGGHSPRHETYIPMITERLETVALTPVAAAFYASSNDSPPEQKY